MFSECLPVSTLIGDIGGGGGIEEGAGGSGGVEDGEGISLMK